MEGEESIDAGGAAPAVIVDGEEAKPIKVEEPKKNFKLDIDADGVFWGATEVLPEDIKGDEVLLEVMPDNRPGVYRWNHDEKRFDPLPKAAQKQAPTAPSVDRVLFDFLSAYEGKLPSSAQQWLDYQRTTIDNR